MIEVWKDIPGYEGYYQASSFGQIKSLDRMVNMGPAGLCLKKGRILRQRINGDCPYYTVKISIDKNPKKVLVHRFVALAFHKNPENKPTVNHKNGKKLENFYANLEWATYSENAIHALETGLSIPLSSEKSSKITETEVLKIKSLLAKKQHTHAQIGEMFGIKRSAVGCINIGKTWKHLN